MAKYIGTILTKKGKDLLVRATLGEVITFTKVEIGKGIIPEGTIKEDLVSLIETFKTLSITSTTVLEAGNYRVRAAFNNSGISEDTYLREIGLFARGEDGIEVLYSYCDTATPDLIPRESSGILERVEDIITYISSAGTVNAVIDQSNVYVTIKDLTEGLLTKENKFTKKSGFNLVISHVVDSASKILVASALAVKTAYDKGLEALGLANTNKNAIQNNTEQIENCFGNNQNWVDVTSLRAKNAVYTNDTSKPIMINLNLKVTTDRADSEFLVDGLAVAFFNSPANTSGTTISIIVPSMSEYEFKTAESYIRKWVEFR